MENETTCCDFVEDSIGLPAQAINNQLPAVRSRVVSRTKTVFADSSDEDALDGEQRDEHGGEYHFTTDEQDLLEEKEEEEEDENDFGSGEAVARRPPVSVQHQQQQPATVRNLETAACTRKRYREEADDVSVTAVDVITETAELEEEVVVTAEFLHTIGAATVPVRCLDRYRLSLNEWDFVDPDAEQPARTGDEADDDEEEEEDDEEELDNIVAISAVEQLVHCCAAELLAATAEESAPSEQPANAYSQQLCARFVDEAKRQLSRLYAKEVTMEDFSEAIQPTMQQLQRWLKREMRPLEVPVIIDGVRMDL